MMDLPPSATSVPSVSVLRQRLDYGDPLLGRVKAFILDLRSFTQRHITSLGIRGSEIIDWRNSEALLEVANTWLETENRGVTYWPHDPNHANSNKYQYLTDELHIKSILMQLIFKANKNANQNQKYKSQHRKQRHSHSSFPTTTSWQCDTTAQLYSPNGSVMQPPHEFTPIIDTTDRCHLNDGNRQTPIDPDLVPTPQEQREEEVVVLPLTKRPHAQTEVLSQNTTPTSTTPQESPPATSDGIEPEQMQRHQEAPTVTTQPVVHIVDANEGILGHLGNIRTHDKRLKHIQSLPIQRKVRIRPGRTFTKKHFTSIHYERDPKRVKRVSCMIQAVGTVQRQRCSNCQRNRGAFAECIIVGGPLFPKCGNCEWNHHGCYISTENGHDPSGSSRVKHAQTLPIYMTPEDHVVETPNGTSRHDQQPIRMEVDDIDLVSKTHQACASDHMSINSHRESRVGIRHQDSFSRNERHEMPTTESNSQHKENPNAQGRPGNQAITILYKLVYSRTPSFKAVYWTPKGSFGSKSLAELTKQIPLSLSVDTNGFLFTFTGPFINIKQEIKPEEDEAFGHFKNTINNAVQDSIRQATIRGLPLVFELCIEEAQDGSLTLEDSYDADFNLWK